MVGEGGEEEGRVGGVEVEGEWWRRGREEGGGAEGKERGEVERGGERGGGEGGGRGGRAKSGGEGEAGGGLWTIDESSGFLLGEK